MRDSDWSRQILLRSDWLLPSVALITTSDDVVFPFKIANAIKTVRVQSFEVTFILNCW